MSAPSAPAPHHVDLPAPAPSLLDVLTHLDEALGDRADHPAQLLRLERRGPDPSDVVIGIAPLPAGHHPLGALLGTTAPPGWDAIGVVAIGRARSLDGTGAEPAEPDGPGAPGEGAAVRILHLVDRAGEAAELLRPLDPPGPAERLSGGEGRIVDACLRALGLPTAPPTASLARWAAARWADAVVAAAAARPHWRWDWPSLVRLHPLVAAQGGPSVPTTAALGRAVHGWAATATWEGERLAATRGGIAGLSPEVVAWLDAGSFSRLALGNLPDPLELVDAVADLAGERAAHEVRLGVLHHLVRPGTRLGGG